MGILDRIFRDQLEVCNGRIRPYPNLWVFEPTEKQAKRTLEKIAPGILESEDDLGRKMYLVVGRGVACPNPAVGEALYPQIENRWWLPLSLCRKCKHYCKTGVHHLRYPHCDWVRQQRGGDIGAARETLGVFNEAKRTADEIMGN